MNEVNTSVNEQVLTSRLHIQPAETHREVPLLRALVRELPGVLLGINYSIPAALVAGFVYSYVNYHFLRYGLSVISFILRIIWEHGLC